MNFFYDLVVDWGSPHYIPDIFEFVPYTWHINVRFEEFELLLQANEFNWIDTASSNPENSKCFRAMLSIPDTCRGVGYSSELCVANCDKHTCSTKMTMLHCAKFCSRRHFENNFSVHFSLTNEPQASCYDKRYVTVM